MAEVGLLLAVIAVPILIGVGMSYLRRPWWWGAVAAICIFVIAALAPPPEDGEWKIVHRHGDGLGAEPLASVKAGRSN